MTVTITENWLLYPLAAWGLFDLSLRLLIRAGVLR